MDVIKAILMLGKVLEKENMSEVARELGISSSAVSQHIQQLEKHYDIKLLNRTTRRIKPTEAGLVMWQGAKNIKKSLLSAEENLIHLQTHFKGEVHLSLPSGFIESSEIKYFISSLTTDYPQIELILHTDDNIADLMEGKIDIAIRAAEPQPNSQLIVRYLTQWQLCLCASPNYLAKKPINSLNDLLIQKWIKYDNNIFDNAFSSLNLGAFASHNILYCPNILTARSLAISGFGITFQLMGEINTAVEKKELEIILPMLEMPSYNIYAVSAHRAQSAKVQCVLTLLKKAFKSRASLSIGE
ncbi:LysR family transcriptional regulator [Pasteurellaceae bacterium HPA106]|uniref:LysR family transcriptional regulator n=1 Tax=Spirabiliibacterium pneumoniae TaxID=221400 RepID=UPI001AADC484|nr:LysR family transcriptional regulator [Spirabiliibacterium pneumoniae]MBE2896512.1 LysR family transcriptional regulator [Spirabiliibacterium pneumoniae]